MKKNIILIIALGFFAIYSVGAQQTEKKYNIFTTVSEAVFVHANTATLFTGETFYYKFYTWNTHTESLSPISKIGYVELINKDGENVLKQKITLKNGMGHGDFFIPSKSETGAYKLIAYTRWILNEPLSELFQMDVFIINPYQSVPESALAKGRQDSLTLNLKTKKINSPILSLQEQSYGKREKATFTISSAGNQLEEGNYSISVRKVDNLPEIAPIEAKGFIGLLGKSSKYKDIHRNYLPELRGELIIGKLENKDNPNNIKDKSVALSMPGKDFVFKLVNTDENGIFRFILDENTNKETAIIQVIGEDRQNYSIKLKLNKIDYSSLEFQKINLTQNLEKAIEERSIAVQIENAYYYLKKDSILPKIETKPFFFPLAKDYILENYTSFPALEKTIIEIVPQMYATKKNGDYTIHLRDFENNTTKAFYTKTLVLVDGLLLQDVNKLFEYDTRKIHKISLVPRGYVYGPKIFNGVVNFVTKEQDFKSNLSGDFIIKKEFLRPLHEKKYFQPDYAKLQSTRIPDYRYQLLWLPEVSLVNETKTISFHTSDVTGTFEIVLEGFTASGEPVSEQQTFMVK